LPTARPLPRISARPVGSSELDNTTVVVTSRCSHEFELTLTNSISEEFLEALQRQGGYLVVFRMLRSPRYGRLSLKNAAFYNRAAKFDDGQVGQTRRPETRAALRRSVALDISETGFIYCDLKTG
jgi:hypothetical protein